VFGRVKLYDAGAASADDLAVIREDVCAVVESAAVDV
jgi:hypothetical protein